MKCLKQILMVTTLSVILVSCRDSLGIDENYIKIPLDNPKDDNSFFIENPDFEFSESNGNETVEDPNIQKFDNYLINSGSFKADTSGTNPVMWLEMNVSYMDDTIKDPVNKNRVLDFKLKLDSAEFGKDYILNGNSNSSNWISVTLLNEVTGELFVLTGSDILAELEFITYDPITNVIICQLTIRLTSAEKGNEILFKGIFKFKLKSPPTRKPISVKPKKI